MLGKAPQSDLGCVVMNASKDTDSHSHSMAVRTMFTGISAVLGYKACNISNLTVSFQLPA